MESIIEELGISRKNILCSPSNNLFTVVVHSTWLKKWLKKVYQNETDVDSNINNINFIIQPGENVPYPYKKIFIRVSDINL